MRRAGVYCGTVIYLNLFIASQGRVTKTKKVFNFWCTSVLFFMFSLRNTLKNKVSRVFPFCLDVY